MNVGKFWRTVRREISELVLKTQLDFFPVRKTLQGYNRKKLHMDFRAGLNVALVAFPQGMAYAVIAGLPIEYGIYGSAIATIVGGFFSGSRLVIFGPTNATSVIVFTSFLALGVTAQEKVALMPLVLSLVGIYLIVGAFLRVAHLIQYISRTVVTGYITAAAFFIILNQLRKVLGIDFEIPEMTGFFGIIKLTGEHVLDTHIPTLFIGLVTALLFIFLRRKWRTWPNVALTLVIMSMATAGLNHLLEQYQPLGSLFAGPVECLSAINASNWWALILPPLQMDRLNDIAKMALIIAFLSIVEGSSIGKSLAARSGERLNTNQEMLSLGLANLGCAMYGGMPASGSLTRSQLNWNSGAATSLASLYCGLICVIAAFVLGPYLKYIPVSALGMLVIIIGASLINLYTIRVVVKTTRSDAIVFATTFLAALLVALDFGIILGTATSIMLFLRKASVPELVEYTFTEEGGLTQLEDQQRPDPEVSIVHVEGELFFGAADLFQDQMRRVVEDPNLKVVVLKMRNAHHLDATSVLALDELSRYMSESGRCLLVSEARKEVIRVFKNSGLIEVIGRENIFPDVTQNPLLSTSRALKRAKAVIGDQKAKVSIYADQAGGEI